MSQPHIFLDCDGVLADFDSYAHAYFGLPPRQYEAKVGSKVFWAELEPDDPDRMPAWQLGRDSKDRMGQ